MAPGNRAVAQAGESARAGASDAAWRTLRDALIAPIGLLADPVLGPLITPERGREILAAPRAGATEPARSVEDVPTRRRPRRAGPGR
ncbi:hypothetical protein OG268_02325 [Streptomyces uncialis]|nr:hypothetical protein OG268_02325 [Streptomyces uncialis]